MDCQKIRYYKKCLYDIYDTERCIHANFHISFPSKYFLIGFKKDLSYYDMLFIVSESILVIAFWDISQIEIFSIQTKDLKMVNTV